MKFTRIITNTLATAMLAGALMLAPQAAEARVFISVGFAPPPIPVYVQPVCPGDGYIWTPGYWQYTDDGYEWVDGQWVLAPYTGALWTPGYWGYGGSGYFWNAGYWGPTVGYYGGINYGFGYFGTGFYGGYGNGGHFFYNREYNHFGSHFTSVNVYSRHIDGFDGRPGGSSFARGVSGGNRGGTFNYASRGGFGQSNGVRVANGSNLRGAYGGVNDRNGSSFAGNGYNNRQSFNQPGQVRPGNTVNNGFGSSARTGQVGNRGGFGSAQPRSNPSGGQSAPRANFGGGSHGGGGGAPHGGGGGGSHGGGHH